MIRRLACLLVGCIGFSVAQGAAITRSGHRLLIDGRPVKLWGVRTASASQNAAATAHLLAQLDDYRRHGLNAVTVFFQGSSGGYSNPFSADGKNLDPAHRARMAEIVEACDRRGMIAIAGIFYQRADFPQDAAAFAAMVRTATRALRPHRNVIVNLVNEQNSSHYRDSNPIFDLGDPTKLIALCDLVHAEDPRRLVGAGGYDHAKNIVLGLSTSVDVLLFDTNGPENSGALHDRFVAAGVKDKPMINVEQFGAYPAKPDFPRIAGVYTSANRALFLREIAAARTRPALHTFFFDVRWLQGTGHGYEVNRYDLGGDGTESAPGWRWYAEAVRDATQ